MRGVGRARWTSEAPKEGILGDALDVLTLVVTSTLALPSAIDAVRRWCGSGGTHGRCRHPPGIPEDHRHRDGGPHGNPAYGRPAEGDIPREHTRGGE
ncbi:effector-associated constant component EACC1 [Streptomyces sp. TR1341]|uniref:effector-associated constant component EACC1 n=1 Tax=Streptomyces sp. TR1341 TaxID=2601266 RepID=UPI00403E4FEF